MFKTLSITSLIAVFAFNVSGCSSKETYTVDFLKNNESKRQEVLAACKENKQSDENCKNANDAENQLKSEEYWNKRMSKEHFENFEKTKEERDKKWQEKYKQ